MKTASRITFSCVICALFSCSACADTPTPQPADETLNRMQAAKLLPVPPPTSTPYDADDKAKEIYLAEYRAGYRTVLAAVNIDCHMGIKGPYLNAFHDGWSDGISKAKKDHPEKAAEMYGLTLEEYLRAAAQFESK